MNIDIPMGGDEFLRLSTNYTKGGINFGTYKQERRGIYVTVLPVKIEKHDGYEVTTSTAFSGFKVLIKELKRKSQKQIDGIHGNLSLYTNQILEMWKENNQDGIYQILKNL